jgi:hypothetical protein
VTRRDRCLERKSRRVQLPPGLAGDEGARVEQPTTERGHDRPIGSRSSVVSSATRARSACSPESALRDAKSPNQLGTRQPATPLAREGNERRDTSPARRDHELVAGLHPPQQGSRVIAQLSGSDLGTHATTVAVA